jgi:hypothetical protein
MYRQGVYLVVDRSSHIGAYMKAAALRLELGLSLITNTFIDRGYGDL